MTELTIDRANSWSGALENWAEEKVKDASAPAVVGLRALQGIASLLAVAETVMWVAFSVLMIPVSLCWCFAPNAVKSFDKFVLNGLAGAAAAIVTPWKQAIASCCCNGSERGQVEDAGSLENQPSALEVTGTPTPLTNPSRLYRQENRDCLPFESHHFRSPSAVGSVESVMSHLGLGGGIRMDNRNWFLNENKLFSEAEIGQNKTKFTGQYWAVHGEHRILFLYENSSGSWGSVQKKSGVVYVNVEGLVDKPSQ